MNAETNKEMIRRFLSEVMQRGNTAVIPELVSESFVDNTAAPGMPDSGHAAVEAYVQMEETLLPDRTIEIIHTVADDEFVVVLTRTSGTHSGALMGIPPSGRHIELTFMHMVRVEDGKFTEHWGFGDLMQQLSAVAQ